MLHNLNQVSNLFVIGCLDEPLPKVALYSHVHHLFLLTGQVLTFYLLLNVCKSCHSHVHHIYIRVLWTHYKWCIRAKLFREGDTHEVDGRLHVYILLGNMH